MIGREIVKYCRAEGGTVIGVDYAPNRWGEEPDVKADVTDTKAIDNLITRIIEQYGRIDGLVKPSGPAADQPRAE